MAYTVIDNGKPANKYHPCIEGLTNNDWHETAVFDSFKEAEEYAKDWFYPYLGNSFMGPVIKVNEPYYYNSAESNKKFKPAFEMKKAKEEDYCLIQET